MSGAMLKAPNNQAADQTNPLAVEIQRTGFCSIGRTAIPNGTYPTVRYYSIASTALGRKTSRMDILRKYMGSVELWAQAISAQIIFMFAQGWLVATTISRPVAAFPAGVAITTSSLHFCNVTVKEVFWWVAQMVTEGLVYGAQMIHQMAGEPGWMAVVILLGMYMAVLCGLSTLVGITYSRAWAANRPYLLAKWAFCLFVLVGD